MSGSSSLGPLLSIPDVQAWLNLDGSENEAQLEDAVATASDAVIQELGWDPRSQSYTETVDSVGGNALRVSNPYITAVSSIVRLVPGCPSVAMDLTSVSWDSKAPVIYSAAGFCRCRACIQPTYTAGFAVVPNPILQATRYTIKAMLDGSGVDFNATGESYAGVLSQTFWQQGPAVVPPSAMTLLTKYKRFL